MVRAAAHHHRQTARESARTNQDRLAVSKLDSSCGQRQAPDAWRVMPWQSYCHPAQAKRPRLPPRRKRRGNVLKGCTGQRLPRVDGHWRQAASGHCGGAVRTGCSPGLAVVRAAAHRHRQTAHERTRTNQGRLTVSKLAISCWLRQAPAAWRVKPWQRYCRPAETERPRLPPRRKRQGNMFTGCTGQQLPRMDGCWG